LSSKIIIGTFQKSTVPQKLNFPPWFGFEHDREKINLISWITEEYGAKFYSNFSILYIFYSV
jgi:hypothetical protein